MFGGQRARAAGCAVLLVVAGEAQFVTEISQPYRAPEGRRTPFPRRCAGFGRTTRWGAGLDWRPRGTRGRTWRIFWAIPLALGIRANTAIFTSATPVHRRKHARLRATRIDPMQPLGGNCLPLEVEYTGARDKRQRVRAEVPGVDGRSAGRWHPYYKPRPPGCQTDASTRVLC